MHHVHVHPSDDRPLDEIRRDALDSNVPVSATLLKLVALGRKADSEKLREWTANELNGY